LGHIQNISAEHVVIEHCLIYHDWSGRVKLALSIHMVENFFNSKAFPEEIGVLRALSRRLVLASPNRRDLLLDSLPDIYQNFLPCSAPLVFSMLLVRGIVLVGRAGR